MATAVQSVEATCFTSRPAAEAYLGGVCFKLGPPQLIGAELEWLTAQLPEIVRPPDLAALAEALGPHTPRTIDPSSPAQPLPGGSVVTVEPGDRSNCPAPPPITPHANCATISPPIRRFSRTCCRPNRSSCRPRPRTPAGPRSVSSNRRGTARWNPTSPASGFGKRDDVQHRRNADQRGRRGRSGCGGEAVAPAPCHRSCIDRGLRVFAAALRGTRRAMGIAADANVARTRFAAHHRNPHIADYAGWVLDVPLLCIRNDGTDWTAPDGATFADWSRARWTT